LCPFRERNIKIGLIPLEEIDPFIHTRSSDSPWHSQRNPIKDLKTTMEKIKEMDACPPIPQVPSLPPGLLPEYDNAGGYFEKGAYNTINFKEFIKRVMNKTLPETFKPSFECIYILPDGTMLPKKE